MSFGPWNPMIETSEFLDMYKFCTGQVIGNLEAMVAINPDSVISRDEIRILMIQANAEYIDENPDYGSGF